MEKRLDVKTVEQVWELLRREVRPREAVAVALAEAFGAVLREDVRSPEDQPAFDRSAVDGFLVGLDDRSETFRIVGEVRAGSGPREGLGSGEALRIATGAAVPEEGCEVVMLEDAVEENGVVQLTRRGRNHVRKRGEDARAGDVVVSKGTVLSVGTIGLLASVGCAEPRVTRPLAVLHVATGNEIVGAETKPAMGQVRDSNSPLVAAWGKKLGIRMEQKRVGEEADALGPAIDGLRDLLIVSGGASVGAYDCTESVLEDAGFEILVNKVAVRPGKPLIVARRGNEWAFGLPGNPLSHFVCLHLFVGATVAAMRAGPAQPVVRQGRVMDALKGNPRETWWPAVEEQDGLRPLRWASSGDLTALASADVLVRVPTSGLAAREKAGFIRT